MTTRLIESLAADTPPADLTRAQQALWWLRKGELRTGPEWDRAHEICAAGEGDRALDRIHALAHWIECDMGNSDYWYRRAGSRRVGADVGAERTRIAEDVSA